MSDTIRKVQIEVDVVNGDLKVNPPDVTSITSTLKQVKEEANATWRAIQGSHTSMGGSSAGNIGGSARSTASADAIKCAADEIREWYSSQQELTATPIKIGRLGYGSSVRARSSSIAQDELDFAKRAGITDGFDQHGINQLRGHLEKRATSSIREVDRETANSTADSVRAENQRAAALNRSRNAAIGAAKGLFQLAAANDKSSQNLMQGVVAIEGLANMAKLAHVAMGPLGIGLTVLAAGILAIKTVYQEAHEASQMYWKSIATDAELSNERITRTALLNHDQGTRLALGIPMTGKVNRFLNTFNLGQEREAEVRKVEAGNFTPEHKAAFRARAEANANLDERQQTAAAEIEFKKKELAKLEAAEADLLQEKKNVETSGIAAVTGAKVAAKHVTDESWLGASYRTGFGKAYALSGVANYGLNVGMDPKTGLFHSQAAAQDKANEQVKAVEESTAKNNLEVYRKLHVTAQQKQKTKDEIANLEMQRLTTTKEQRDTAYNALNTERQRVTGLNQNFGAASAGERRIAMRLQEKHLRIETQRAANKAAGRPEDEGIEQYSHWEMQQNTFGGIADKSMRQQREAIAKKEGHLVETDVDQLEAKHKEEEAKPLQPQIDNVKAAGIDVEKGAKELADAIKAAFPFEDLVEKLKAELKQMELDNQQKAMKRNNWFG